MQDLIRFIASTLVDHPDDVDVQELDGGRRLQLQVHPDDVGQIIGRRGQTAQAMRTLLRLCGQGPRGGCDLDIDSPAESDAE